MLAALGQILEKGALGRFFRPEGKMSDDVQTYEQSTRLNGYVMDLQKFDALLKKEMLRRTITIEGRELTGIEDKVFKI